MSLSTILNLLSDNHLTADELLLVYLTFLARDEEGQPEYFEKWYTCGGQERLKDLFTSLKEKGIIVKSYKPTTYDPNDIQFNQHFLRRWTRSSNELGLQLFSAYPSWINVNGKNYPARDIAKKFNSIDDFARFYATSINNDPEKHKEVMELLKWGIDNGHVTFGLCNFVVGQQWEALKELRDNPEYAPLASNICIIDE